MSDGYIASVLLEEVEVIKQVRGDSFFFGVGSNLVYVVGVARYGT